jgi:Regulator of ribonuclease activity B
MRRFMQGHPEAERKEEPLFDPTLSFRQILEALQLAGVEPDDKPHHLLFVISYPEEDLVRQAAQFLDRAHERAFGRQHPGGGTVRRIAERTWQLIIGAHMALEPEVFDPMETVARTLAEMFGGTYQGWRDETGFPGEEAVQQALRLMATEGGKA